MGCDIHLRLQVQAADGSWDDFPTDFGCAEDRNYTVFSFLANVRNGMSAWPPGALPTGRVITPQVAGRGLPDGIEPDPWIGDHSFTWATVAELQSLDWDTEIETAGCVYASTYNDWIASGEKCPDHWCGGTNQPVVPAECLRGERAPDGVYVHARWKWPAVAQSGFRQWLNTLTPDVLGVSTDRARVLMGFDS